MYTLPPLMLQCMAAEEPVILVAATYAKKTNAHEAVAATKWTPCKRGACGIFLPLGGRNVPQVLVCRVFALPITETNEKLPDSFTWSRSICSF